MTKIILTEKEILTTIRLSGVQKSVLAKIVAAATPEVGYEQISNGRNFVAARDILKKLGLIDFSEGTASMTEAGNKVMKDENLMDDTGQLTSDGQSYVEAETPNDIKKPQAGTADPLADPEAMGAEDDLGLDGEEGAGDEDPFSLDEPMESISLIQKANKSVRLLESVGFTPQDIRDMKSDNELSEDLLEKLYYFVEEHDPTWMPYGTKKARDGDPGEWIMEHLDEIIRIVDASSVK